MLLNKPLRFAIVITGLAATFYLFMSLLLGPGIADSSVSIINEYEFVDSGHYEKLIIYAGSKKNRNIIVDARVDAYRVEGNIIYVARRPREIYKDNGVVKSRLSSKCEYIIIDTVAQSVVVTDTQLGLNCKGIKGSDSLIFPER